MKLPEMEQTSGSFMQLNNPANFMGSKQLVQRKIDESSVKYQDHVNSFTRVCHFTIRDQRSLPNWNA